MRKSSKRDIERAALVLKTANITGVTPRQVRRVLDGTSTNEGVMTVYMELSDGDNKLMQSVKELVPFNGHRPRELKVQYVEVN